VVLDKLAIRADETTSPGQILGAARAWREAGEMKEDVTITMGGGFVPNAQASILRSGKGDEWAVTSSGTMGGFEGKATVSADGSVRITGKWTVADIAVVEKQIPGWPFKGGESVGMDEVIDGTGAWSVRYTPMPASSPDVLLGLLVPGESGDWKPAGDAPYVKYADKRPVELSAKLVRKDKGEIRLSGGQEEGGIFHLRVTHADGRGKDIRFTWDDGWKKKDEAEVAPANERRKD
jgi:hypothetical protein